jgi:hypothetical protein
MPYPAQLFLSAGSVEELAYARRSLAAAKPPPNSCQHVVNVSARFDVGFAKVDGDHVPRRLRNAFRRARICLNEVLYARVATHTLAD